MKQTLVKFDPRQESLRIALTPKTNSIISLTRSRGLDNKIKYRVENLINPVKIVNYILSDDEVYAMESFNSIENLKYFIPNQCFDRVVSDYYNLNIYEYDKFITIFSEKLNEEIKYYKSSWLLEIYSQREIFKQGKCNIVFA